MKQRRFFPSASIAAAARRDRLSGHAWPRPIWIHLPATRGPMPCRRSAQHSRGGTDARQGCCWKRRRPEDRPRPRPRPRPRHGHDHDHDHDHGNGLQPGRGVPSGHICETGRLSLLRTGLQSPALPQGRRDTQLHSLYWSRRGNPGYRVLAPLYWHFWSPEARTQIVFPFYWRVEDHLKQRVVTVVGLYSQTRQPDARSWAVWPFLYTSTKFGWAAPILGSFAIGDPDKGRAFGLLSFLYFWKRSPDSKFDVCPLFVSSRSKESAFTYALPLNFYWRSGHESTLLIVPVGFATPTPRAATSDPGWLLVAGRRQQDRRVPLAVLVRPQQGLQLRCRLAAALVVPLTRGEHHIIPPMFHVRRGSWSIGSAALLAWWDAIGTKAQAGSSSCRSFSLAMQTTARRPCICRL